MARRRSPGEHSVYQRKDTGRWRAALVVGYQPNGNPQRVSRDFDTKREADAWINEQAVRLKRGELSVSETTLEMLFVEWLAIKKQQTRESTHLRYVDISKKYILPTLGKHKVSELKPTHISRWIASLQTSGKSTYTVFRAHEFLSMALNYALNLELIYRNPAHKIRPPRPPKPKLERLTAVEVTTFLTWCQTNGERYGGRHKGEATKRREGPHKISSYAHVLLTTGMRREELLGLRWADVHFEEGYLEIKQTVVFVGGKATFGPPKTEEGQRVIMLDEGTLETFRVQQAHVAELRASAREKWQEHDLVFPSIIGTAMPESTLLRWWWDAIEGSGVSAVRLYDGRATWISEALKRGMNPKAVAKRVGHRDIAFMLKTYARPDEDEMRQAAKSIAEMYGPQTLRLVPPELEKEKKAE